MWIFAILIVLALGAVGFVAAGRGEGIGRAERDLPDAGVPVGRSLTAYDLRRVRLPVVVRGYRMADVDALLERLALEAEERGATGSPWSGSVPQSPPPLPEGAPTPPPVDLGKVPSSGEGAS